MAADAPTRVAWWQRLSLRIYLTLLASLVLAAGLLMAIFAAGSGHAPEAQPPAFATLTELAAALLPPAGAPVAQQQAQLDRWQGIIDADLALYSAQRALLAAAGEPMPALDRQRTGPGWQLAVGGNRIVLQLPDRRWLLMRFHRQPIAQRPLLGLLLLAAMIVIAVALVAYPLVRRMTARLERLQRSVEQFGSGELGARVLVQGDDEIALLARSFNRSAAQVETLLAEQKHLLANASHELRSPLARIRLATELLGAGAGPELSAELTRNIAELDQLIDEILLASRLNSATPALNWQRVDLAGLAAEECARAGAALYADPCQLNGDPRLLRRLLRNLLENAARHGGDGPVDVRVRAASTGAGAGGISIEVKDQGPGIPPAQREAVFAPFYRLPGSSEREGGVGLGLSLVRQIARAHGGEVSNRGNADGSNAFVVVLPG